MKPDAPPKRAVVETMDSSGARLAQQSGAAVFVGAGNVGGSIETVFPGGLTQIWKIPREGTRGNVTMTFEPTGHSASLVRRATKLISSLQETDAMTITVDGMPLSARLGGDFRGLELPVEMLEYVEDLSTIENKADVTLAFPAEFPNSVDRIMTRVARMLLEGKCVILPVFDQITATLSGAGDEALVSFLENGGAIRAALEFIDITTTRTMSFGGSGGCWMVPDANDQLASYGPLIRPDVDQYAELTRTSYRGRVEIGPACFP